MIVRTKWRRDAFRRMTRPIGCVKLPIVGLADVRNIDGKAYLFPGCSGSAVIVVEWFAYCRWLRRHKLIA